MKSTSCDLDTRGNSWKRTGQDGTGEDKGSERMENTNKSQVSRSLTINSVFIFSFS